MVQQHLQGDRVEVIVLEEAIAKVGQLAVTRQEFQEIGYEVTRDGRGPR
jgi:hypothetical protein